MSSNIGKRKGTSGSLFNQRNIEGLADFVRSYSTRQSETKDHLGPSMEFCDDSSDSIREETGFETSLNLTNPSLFQDFPMTNPDSNNHPKTADSSPASWSYVQHFSKEHKFLIRLLGVLNQPSIPLYVFDSIIRLIRDAVMQECDFHIIGSSSRKSCLQWLQKIEKKPLPNKVKVELEDAVFPKSSLPQQPTSVNTIVYSSYDQILDFLNDDQIFGSTSHLVLNTNCPFGKYQKRCHKEMYGAARYHDIWLENKLEEAKDWLLLGSIYMDATGVTVNQRLSLLPVVLSFGIVKKEFRFKNKYTRILGYIPTQSRNKVNLALQANSRASSKGINCRNFHRMLQPIINSLNDAHKRLKESPVRLKIGPHIGNRTIHFFPLFFIGDAKQQDMLACRYGTYQNANQISRFCMTCYDDADKTDSVCVPISKNQIRELVHLLPHHPALNPTGRNNNIQHFTSVTTRLQLKELNVHICHNSLWNLNDGNNPILPLPHDTMHLFSGIFQKMMEVLIENFSNQTKIFIDDYADKLFSTTSSSAKDTFPRIKTSKGLTHLSLMTADEWSGLLLACIILMKTKTFREYLSQNSIWKKPVRSSNDTNIPEIIEKDNIQECIDVMEKWLCLQACCAYGLVGQMNWDRQKEMNMRMNLAGLLEQTKFSFPRESGTGWKIQKFHEILHLPHDITSYGLPANYNASEGERELKTYAKHPAKKIGKDSEDALMWQVNMRLHESILISSLYDKVTGNISDFPDSVWHSSDLNVITEIRQKQPLWTVKLRRGQIVSMEWQKRSMTTNNFPLHRVILDTICRSHSQIQSTEIWGYTEVWKNDKLFRCHPQYKERNEWNDWCTVVYDPTSLDDSHEQDCNSNKFPAKLLALFSIGSISTSNKLNAVIHSTTYSSHLEDSEILETWKMNYLNERKKMKRDNMDNKWQVIMKPVIDIINVSSIDEQIWVIEERQHPQEIIKTEAEEEIVWRVKERKTSWPYSWNQLYSNNGKS